MQDLVSFDRGWQEHCCYYRTSLNNYDDLKIIKKELKLISYHSYIATFFTNYEYRNKLLLIIFIDLELIKIIRSNLDKNILLTKLGWWKISCLESIDGKYYSVPSLRLLNKYFENDSFIKKEFSILINYLIKYSNAVSYNKKIKFYSKYLLIKNKIIFYIIKSKSYNLNIKRSLNFLAISKSLSEHNNKELSNKFFYKAKKICNRPNKKYLILFLLNSNNYFTKSNLYKRIFIVFNRGW